MQRYIIFPWNPTLISKNNEFREASTSNFQSLGFLEFLVLLELLVLLEFLEPLVLLVLLDLLEKKSLWPKPEALIFNPEPRVRGEQKRVWAPLLYQ